MNPVIKQRLPSSLRSLLTDITPKEKWTDIEPDLEMRGDIKLPCRGATAASEEFLTQASDNTAGGGIHDNSKRRAVCMICNRKPSLYTCPRCNVVYCSLLCYKNPEHYICSEQFYKESVLLKMKEMGKTETECKKKMQEILLELRKKAENASGGMESLLKEEGILSAGSQPEPEDSQINVKVIELLSRLAELQEDDEENSEEIETILRNLSKIDLEDDDEALEDESVNEEELNSTERELNIEKLSEEELWDLLTKKEKDKFVNLMKHGALGGLVSLWKPWWEEHGESGQLLIEVIKETRSTEKNDNANTFTRVPEETLGTKSSDKVGSGEEQVTKTSAYSTNNEEQTGVPPIAAKIPKLSSLCLNPSPLVGYSLINVLFGYSFALFFFNGDIDPVTHELCDMILALSEALNSNRVFNSVQEALDSGEKFILSQGFHDKEDVNAAVRAVEAVAHILTGRDRTDSIGYSLSALSQLKSVLWQTRASLCKERDEGNKRQKYFRASKKCEFLLAWVMENCHVINVFAHEVWNEHHKKEREIFLMTQEKSVVEQLKEVQRESCKMVEEL